MGEVEKVLAKAAGLQQLRDLIAIEECVLSIMTAKPDEYPEMAWSVQMHRRNALCEVEETLERGLAPETP